jgi:hypothetical protein
MGLPLVIEFVDTEGKIQGFLPGLNEMLQGGLVTIQKVRVRLSRGCGGVSP